MEIAVIIKAVAFIIAIIAGFLGIRGYGVSQRKIGQQEGISQSREVNDENYTELANDVLDGPHPFRVRDDGVAEIASPNPDPGTRMATDIRPEGESDRLARDRNGST